MAEIVTDLAALRDALRRVRRIVFDFETSGLQPRLDTPICVGIYCPEVDGRYCIRIAGNTDNPRVPLFLPADLVAVLRPFVQEPANWIIGHNVPFDLRQLFALGIEPREIRCRVSDTLIWTHRCDENYHHDSLEPTTFDERLTYGLKELTTAFFNISPTRILEATAGRNAMFADPWPLAQYCVDDCVNTWRLFERASRIIEKEALQALVDEIDDPSNVPLAAMLWNGIQVDVEEARRQQADYEALIQRIREQIWKDTDSMDRIETPTEIIEFLKLKTGIADRKDSASDLNPFVTEYAEDQRGNRLYTQKPSISREYMIDAITRVGGDSEKRLIALFIAKGQLAQRINAFLRPIPQRVMTTQGRLYPDRFMSTLTTTRYSSSPNVQNLPSKADKTNPNDSEEWQQLIDEEFSEPAKTKNIFVATPGCKLVAFDLKTAEPRYMAMIFQNALLDRGRSYRAAIQRRRVMAEQRYPKLYNIMRSMQAQADANIPEQAEPEWPDYEEDPLHAAFRNREDPYNALLQALMPDEYAAATDKKMWFKDNRPRGKRAFLALAYGSQANTLAKPLGWTVERTQQALDRMRSVYRTLTPLEHQTLLEVFRLGEVRSLWGRPRRLNGYHQLTTPQELRIGYGREVRNRYQAYEMKIVTLGTYKRGVQAFVEDCYHVNYLGQRGKTVLQGNRDGTIRYKDSTDPFVLAVYFNQIPFRNIGYSLVKWAETIRDDGSRGLRHYLATEARAQRQAFNARCQMTGADHLRFLTNRVSEALRTREDFRDCNLILTVHDSLLFEVPESVVSAFIQFVTPIMTIRPPWSDIDFEVEVEVGAKYGEMSAL